MIKGIYAIYDKKAKFYQDAIIAPNDEVAVRMLRNLFNDPNSQQSEIVLNAADLTLNKLGEFDNSTGLINENNMEDLPTPLVDLITFNTGAQNEK